MNSLELISHQRQKEGKLLKILLVSSLAGSLAIHAGAMMIGVGNFWSQTPPIMEDDEIELTVTEAEPAAIVPENLLTETPSTEALPPAPDSPPESVAFAPDLTPPPLPLAPASPATGQPGDDAPSSDPPNPTADPVTPLTSETGDAVSTDAAHGSATQPDQSGTGFGTAEQPTAFAPSGQPNGQADGKPGGSPTGKSGGDAAQTAVRTTPPVPTPTRSQDPVCVSCPKPKFQGTEASPRVDLRIRPDGSVEVRLRKSSGNPAVDRATLEAMSQWRFDPQTVPQDGVRKRVRVTYEEEGSTFQRQNEQRRRQEAERRQVAEQEQREAEAERPTPSPAAAIVAPPVEPPVPAAEPAPPPAPIVAPPPAPEPAYAAPPEPAYVPPEPVYAAPPEPADAPPPEPVEAPVSEEL